MLELAYTRAVLNIAQSRIESGRINDGREILNRAARLIPTLKLPRAEILNLEHALRGLLARVR